MNDERNGKHSMWVGLGKQVLSGLVGAMVAAFVLGGARQRMADVGQWRANTEPRIERMDSQGTISFQHWKGSYEKEQAQQYTRLQKLEDQVGHLESMKMQIARLEREMNGQDKNRP